MQVRAVNRAVKSKEFNLPAPIMGLNKRDALSDMNPLFAVQMDNYIPLDNQVELRPGYSLNKSFGSNKLMVESLMAYRYPNNDTLLAVYNNKIWNITGGNQTDLGVTLTNNYCQTVQYKNYLYIMNGSDTPQAFYVDAENVAHIGDWGFSNENLVGSRIIAGAVSKNFLWFIEKGTLKAWYSAQAGNVQGELNSFDLSMVSKFGGELVAIANWTIDGGDGIDDKTVFITSEGEALVYTGYNPNNADNWILVGTYKISKPIGYKCLLPFQGDVIIICEDGYFPLSKALATLNTGNSVAAFSDNIRGLVIERTAKNKNKKGWQGVIYSKKGYGIFNVPVSEQFEQHVINIATGAWCRFTGMRSACWCVFGDNIYFGAEDAVYQFDDGYSDNGTEIEGLVEQAYSNLGYQGIKKIQLLNPRTAASTPYTLGIYTNADYSQARQKYYANVGHVSGSEWGQVYWSYEGETDGTTWVADSTSKINSQWISNSCAGVNISVVFTTKTKGIIIDWFDTGIRYQIGTGII